MDEEASGNVLRFQIPLTKATFHTILCHVKHGDSVLKQRRINADSTLWH